MYEGFCFVVSWNVRGDIHIYIYLHWHLCITFVSLVGAVLDHFLFQSP